MQWLRYLKGGEVMTGVLEQQTVDPSYYRLTPVVGGFPG
jgi:hypothetical protein